MRARVTVALMGIPSHDIGDVVEGDTALQLVQVGYADAIEGQPVVETAAAKRKRSTRSAEPVDETEVSEDLVEGLDQPDTDEG